jgi:hypothetical protein
VNSNLTRPRGLALDAEEGLLYWTDQVTRFFMSEVIVKTFSSSLPIIIALVVLLVPVLLRTREGFSGIADPIFPLDPVSKGLKGNGDLGSAIKNLIIFNPKTCY